MGGPFYCCTVGPDPDYPGRTLSVPLHEVEPLMSAGTLPLHNTQWVIPGTTVPVVTKHEQRIRQPEDPVHVPGSGTSRLRDLVRDMTASKGSQTVAT